MSNSRSWREFIEFWHEMSPKAYLYEAKLLGKIIDEQIRKIQKRSNEYGKRKSL